MTDSTAPEPEEAQESRSHSAVPLLVASGVAVAVIVVLVALFALDDGSNQAEGVTFDLGPAPTVNTGEGPAPQVQWTYFDGSTGSVEEFAGTPLVINFFASWCAPCVTEMPGFQEVYEEVGDEVAFIGMNTQDRQEDGQRIADQTSVTYPLARDPDGTIFAAFRLFAMPSTVFIDASGEVVRLHSGIISSEDLREVIATELGA